MFDIDNEKDKLKSIIKTNPTIQNDCQSILEYIISLEERLKFILNQNGAYKQRNDQLTTALEKMILKHCQIGEYLNHNCIEANILAFKTIGLQNGCKIEILENLLEGK